MLCSFPYCYDATTSNLNVKRRYEWAHKSTIVAHTAIFWQQNLWVYTIAGIYPLGLCVSCVNVSHLANNFNMREICDGWHFQVNSFEHNAQPFRQFEMTYFFYHHLRKGQKSDIGSDIGGRGGARMKESKSINSTVSISRRSFWAEI